MRSPLRSRVVLLLAPLALLLSSLSAPASAAPAVDGISARAVDASGKSIGTAYFVEERNPGSKFVGHLSISNSGKTFTRLHIDAVDAVTSTRGGTVFAPRDDPDKTMGAWMKPDKDLIRLEPGQSRTVAFTVTIPPDARPGDHVGGIAIEPLRRATSGGQFAVTQVLRVAVATQIRVRGTANKALTPKVLRLEAITGSEVPALYVKLANDGELLCKPTLTATLYQDGQPLSSEKREIDTILARSSIDYPLYWPRGLKAGTYDAAVRTEGCGKAVQTQAEVKLANDLSGQTKPGVTGPAPEPPSEPTPTWIYIVGGILLLLILLAAGWWLSRRAARRARERLLAELRDEDRGDERRAERGQRNDR